MSTPATPHANRARRSSWATLLPLTVVAVALFASVASTDENEPQLVDDASETSADADTGSADGSASGDSAADGAAEDTAAPQVFAVGDLVELGDWQVRVHGVTDPFVSTNEILQPSEGNRWVAVDVEVINTSSEPETVSSFLCFELVDDLGRSFSQTVTGASGAQPPDGEVAANGGTRRGTIEYEVPSDATGLHLQFACDLFSQGTARIALGG